MLHADRGNWLIYTNGRKVKNGINRIQRIVNPSDTLNGGFRTTRTRTTGNIRFLFLTL